ncbi:hypothetical protein ACFX11_008902 [Malus domestica]
MPHETHNRSNNAEVVGSCGCACGGYSPCRGGPLRALCHRQGFSLQRKTIAEASRLGLPSFEKCFCPKGWTATIDSEKYNNFHIPEPQTPSYI